MELTDQLALLKQVIFSLAPLTDPQWERMAAIWQPFAARRKEILTTEGTVEKYVYFVTSGVQRVYYYDEYGREATIVFTYAPSFGGVIDAMLLQEPSAYFYETLTTSSFLRASASALLLLMDEDKDIAGIIHKGVVRALSGIMERMAELQSYSSEEKFRKLLSRSPHILQLVPHKYLANYLGIDPTNFSKLINKIRI